MKQHERLEYITALFKATRQEIRSGAESYMSFLTFASRNYKYAYHQQLLFYAQNPNATAIATFDIWDELRNPVKRGSTALWALSDDGVSLQHYFDISDTIFPNKFRPWVSLEEKYKPKAIDALKESLEKLDVNLPKNQNMDTTLENIVIQYSQELLSASKIENLQAYTEFFIRSVQFGVSRRIGITPHVSSSAFDSVSRLSDAQLTQLQAAVCTATSKILKLTERIITKLEREEHHENKNDKRRETSILGGNGDLFTYHEEDGWKNLSAGRGNNDLQAGTELAGSSYRDVRNGVSDNASRELPKLLGRTDNNDASERLLEAEERGVRKALSEDVRTAHGQIEQDTDGQLYGGVAAEERGGGASEGNSDERNAGGSSDVQKPDINKITVLVVEPKKVPYQKEIPTGVEALQNIIGGSITITELADGVDIISADEYPAEPTVNRLVKGFPFYETFVIAGVNYEDGETVSLSPAQLEKYSRQFEAPIIEIPREAEKTAAHSHSELVEKALLSGGNIEGGKERIYTFFRTNSSQKERAKFLKDEYGSGGSYIGIGDGGHFDRSHGPKGLTLDYRDDTLQFIDKMTWTQAANGIDKLIKQGRYPIPDSWIEPEIEISASQSNHFSEMPETAEAEQLSLFDAQEYLSEVESTAKQIISARTSTADKAVSHTEPSFKSCNYTFPSDFALPNGQKAKYKCNMDAIELLKRLEKGYSPATPEQQEVLAHYSGWGGIPQAFDESNKAWEKEYQNLKAVLDKESYECARASVNNAHFTTPLVIREIYEAIGKFGFENGNVFEPALGIGNFYGAMPKEMQSSKLYGTELDSITGRIAKQLAS